MKNNTYMKNLKELGFPNHCITEDGKVFSLNSNRFLKTQTCSKGYHKITLFRSGERKTFRIHRLVALFFLETIQQPEDFEVNHLDGNKDNNHYSNLEWDTSLGNTQHAIVTGLRDVHYKLTEGDVHRVCKLLQEGYRNVDVANITGVSKSHISSIKTGRCYPEIVQEYDITFVKKSDKLSLEKVTDICKFLSEGLKDYQIAKKLNVNHRVVGTIRKRLTHTNISINYYW